MQLAIITENFPPCAGGGIAEWAFAVADNLGKLGHGVDVLSKWKKDLALSVHNDRHFRLQRMAGRDWRRYRTLYSLYYLWRFLRRYPDGVILATTWELAVPFARLRQFFPQARLIVIAHGVEITRVQSGSPLQKLRATLASASLVAAVSRFTQNAIRERIDPAIADRVVFIPNGVDSARFRPVLAGAGLRQKFGIGSDAKIILTLARVIERKGHDTVIRALPSILQEFPDTVYLIAGPWQEPYRQKLLTLIEALDLHKQVIFTGFVSDDALNEFYSTSEVYVMVSRTLADQGDSEGFGITFLEANACGCPVIGSTAGGIGDAIEHGKSGFLVPPDDVPALSEAILTLFRNPQRAKEIGQYGRRRVEEHFAWRYLTQKLLAEFQQRQQATGVDNPSM